MHERTLVALIRKRCRELGLHHLALTTHMIPGGSIQGPGPAGFPDFVIAGPAGVLLRECKSASRMSRAQLGWGKILVQAGADYAVWRPGDWESGRIERELLALTGRAAAEAAASAGATARTRRPSAPVCA